MQVADRTLVNWLLVLSLDIADYGGVAYMNHAGVWRPGISWSPRRGRLLQYI